MVAEWYNTSHNIIVTQFTEIESWHVIYEMVEEVSQMVATKDTNVALIATIASDVLLPTEGFSEFAANIMATWHNMPINPIILITHSSSVIELWEVAISLYPQPDQHYYFANNLEEAEMLIATNAQNSVY